MTLAVKHQFNQHMSFANQVDTETNVNLKRLLYSCILLYIHHICTHPQSSASKPRTNQHPVGAKKQGNKL